MFKFIFSKLGYYKLSEKQIKLLNILTVSNNNQYDVFIDYVKSKNCQKAYVKKGKKIILQEYLN